MSSFDARAQSTTRPGQASVAGPPRETRDTVVLALACVAQFMVVLDVSIVTVALPSIGRDLHYSPAGLQWVVNAYVLTFAGFLLLGGRAADVFGRRRVYLFGLGLFTVASLAGGFAVNSAWLTAARAAQGVAGAFLSPATLTIVITTFSGDRRARAIGVWSAVAGAGGAAGAILGGVLTSALSWRWVLFVNVPIGMAAIIAALVWLTESRGQAREVSARRLDAGGAITVTAGLAVLIYAIVGTESHPWGSGRTLSLLAVAAVLLAAFAIIELRLVRTPLMPFGLFRSRSVSAANTVMFLIGAAFFSMW
jgi:MFS family permease